MLALWHTTLVAFSPGLHLARPHQRLSNSGVVRSAQIHASSPQSATEDATGAPSFVQTEMRRAAMALHTRDQAPKEGKQPAQKPVTSWQPGRPEYLRFLVDSREVYRTLEQIVANEETLAPFRDSGLERVEALSKDIAWFEEEGLAIPAVGQYGQAYSEMLQKMAADGEWERFVCHFYNTYFAHTAGGRMIGKRMAGMLLDGRTLEFYKWEQGDVDTELLPALRSKLMRWLLGGPRSRRIWCWRRLLTPSDSVEPYCST